jgi:hypothetical protein
MPQQTDPPGLTYCKVTGNFAALVADGVDASDKPDWQPMTGTAEITPNIAYGKNFTLGYKRTHFPRPITVTIDTDGDLSYNGAKWIYLLAGGPDISPAGFNYKIKFTLTPPGEETPITYGPYDFEVVAGGEVDLTDATPVDSSGGTPVSKGLKGDPGDMTPATAQTSVTGAVGLLAIDFPSTRLWTLTGNVTLTLPTPAASHSATITLILTQDATGGRTITWPAAVKWPDGIAQQPAAGANTISAIHLLWTGTQWLGLVGGKSFA